MSPERQSLSVPKSGDLTNSRTCVHPETQAVTTAELYTKGKLKKICFMPAFEGQGEHDATVSHAWRGLFRSSSSLPQRRGRSSLPTSAPSSRRLPPANQEKFVTHETALLLQRSRWLLS